MQFEQPAELNWLVDRTIPLTWPVRRRAIGPVMPLLVCCSVILMEQVALRLWLSNRSLASELPLILVCAMVPILSVMAAFELQVRITRRNKRTINFDPKRISISPAKYNRVPWNRVRSWRFEPLSQAQGLSKLTFEYGIGMNGKQAREWSIALRQNNQEHEILSELEHYRQIGLNKAQLVRLSAPFVPVDPKRRLRSMIAAAVGFYLLVHGCPLLFLGLFPGPRHADEARQDSQFTANERAKFQQIIARTFSSRQQFQHFLLLAGGGLTAAGAGLYFWGLSKTRRSDIVQNPKDFVNASTAIS
jgi:hypothetical protein